MEGKINLRHPAAFGAFLRGDLENALVASTPGGIEAQEKAGQVALVNGDTLPKETLRCTRTQLESIGIVFGEDAGELFVRCTLPNGWRKVETDHDMWSRLLDANGRVRANIFYKAAFLGRSMIDPLTITDEPTSRAMADMIFVESIEEMQEPDRDIAWSGWDSLSWDQRKVKASEIIRRQRNSAVKTGA